jgi:hypothetical protein
MKREGACGLGPPVAAAVTARSQSIGSRPPLADFQDEAGQCVLDYAVFPIGTTFRPFAFRGYISQYFSASSGSTASR